MVFNQGFITAQVTDAGVPAFLITGSNNTYICRNPNLSNFKLGDLVSFQPYRINPLVNFPHVHNGATDLMKDLPMADLRGVVGEDGRVGIVCSIRNYNSKTRTWKTNFFSSMFAIETDVWDENAFIGTRVLFKEDHDTGVWKFVEVVAPPDSQRKMTGYVFEESFIERRFTVFVPGMPSYFLFQKEGNSAPLGRWIEFNINEYAIHDNKFIVIGRDVLQTAAPSRNLKENGYTMWIKCSKKPGDDYLQTVSGDIVIDVCKVLESFLPNHFEEVPIWISFRSCQTTRVNLIVAKHQPHFLCQDSSSYIKDRSSSHNSSPHRPLESSPPCRPDHLPPHLLENASPRRPDHLPPHLLENASPRRTDLLPPHRLENASFRRPDHLPSPRLENASPRRTDLLPPHRLENASFRRPDHLPPLRLENAPPCFSDRSLPRRLENAPPHRQDYLPPHHLENASPRRPDNLPSPRLENALFRRPDHLPPLRLENAPPHRPDYLPPHRLENASPHRPDHLPPRRLENAPPHRQDHLPPYRLENAPPHRLDRSPPRRLDSSPPRRPDRSPLRSLTSSDVIDIKKPPRVMYDFGSDLSGYDEVLRLRCENEKLKKMLTNNQKHKRVFDLMRNVLVDKNFHSLVKSYDSNLAMELQRAVLE